MQERAEFVGVASGRALPPFLLAAVQSVEGAMSPLGIEVGPPEQVCGSLRAFAIVLNQPKRHRPSCGLHWLRLRGYFPQC